jgi:hypothetical protein
MSLHCLIYTSIAKERLTDSSLKNLLNKSRSNNTAFNITGMLLYMDPFFIQILEGGEIAVNEIFRKITEDPIHHKISLIVKKSIEERSFSSWAMGFNKLSEESIESVMDLDTFYNSDDFKKCSSEIVELLEMFRNETLF